MTVRRKHSQAGAHPTQTPELAETRLAWARRPSPSVATAMAQSTGFSRTVFVIDVPGEELAFGVELGGVSDGSFELVVAMCSQATPSCRPRQVLLAEVRDCARCPFGRRLAPPCLVHGQAVEGAIEDGAGKRGARLRLDAALEAAEDGHVAGL